MLGAIVGDVVGSRFEFNNHKSKEFNLFTPENFCTDDSIMTLAVAKSIMEANKNYDDLEELAVKNMVVLGRKYPYAGYGGRFGRWLHSDEHKPYNSYGNGSAMRVSPCGYAAKTLDEAKMLSYKVTKVTHDHYEGIKGAEAVSVAIFLARKGKSKEEIDQYIKEQYYPKKFTLDEIRDDYDFYEDCMNSVPQAIEAFIESSDFEDAIRNAISIGGDSDTIAAITGSIAEAYYGGVPYEIRRQVLTYMDDSLKRILIEFESDFQ